jgi:hypothetical protein
MTMEAIPVALIVIATLVFAGTMALGCAEIYDRWRRQRRP